MTVTAKQFTYSGWLVESLFKGTAGGRYDALQRQH